MKYVFLPGLDGIGILFEPIIRLMKENEPSIVLSYPLNTFLDYDALESRVRPQLPAAEPYILIAESFGGPLATRIAARELPYLRGLVLSATFMRKPQGSLGNWAKRFVGPYIFKGGILGKLGRLAMKIQGVEPWQRALLLKALDQASPEVLAARLTEALEVDAVADLQHVRVPVLCLYAKRDLLLETRCKEVIGEANPRVRMVGLDTPHFLLQTKPAEAWREIQNFAAEIKRPA